PGIIIDMRQNGGGSPDIGNVMLGYFFDEPIYAGTSAFYYEDIDRFEFDPLYDTTILPAAEADRYRGEVAVLVGPACYSMCEFFSYTMTLADAAIVGQYPTGGLGGGIKQFAMPEGLINQFTVGRAVGADNEIHIEGTGVVPTVDVPVDEETLFSEGDPILEAAEAYLAEATSAEVIDGGAISIGDTVTGTLAENQRVRYSLAITANDYFTIRLGDEAQALDTYVWVYLEGQEEPVIENDDGEANAPNSEIAELRGDKDETIIIEVGTFEDAAAGDYVLEIIDLNAAEATEEAMSEGTAAAEATEEVAAATAEAAPEATAEVAVATEEAVAVATEEAAPMGTVLDIAMGNEDFSTLVTAVTMAGQAEALRGEGPFTIFAPTNDAFNSLDPEVLSQAMADSELLTNILSYHVVAGQFTAADLTAMDGQTLPTLYEGNDLTVTVAEDGSILINGIKVITSDIQATNGVIHVIEAVLVPSME
ncbi:MAG: fasciclin domain-containing protein, partial [Anaerolineae bacterium]|nr:fasciclin domain-containing protein [Anaerolineae bacterium]